MLNEVPFLFVKDVIDLWYSGYFLFLAVGKLWKKQEDKAFNKDEVKKQLIESITINNALEIEELDEWAEREEKPEDAANIIRVWADSSHKKEGHHIGCVLSRGGF